jgi:putative spermidine/putrescine transport system substrate-binding protein
MMRGITLATVMAAALASAVALAEEPKFDGVVLRVATFGGGWDKAVHEFIGVELEKRGGKVEYVLAPPREALARLIAARGRPIPFDVVEMADNTWLDTFEGNFLQKIDLGKIDNKKFLDSFQYDEWKVASWTTQEGIIYDAEKLKQAGIAPPQHYRDLADPRLAGKVVIVDVSQAGSTHFLVGAARDDGGSDANLGPGLELLSRIKPRSYWKLGAEALTLIETGEAWVVTMHAGFAIQAKKKGMPVAFTHPVIGNNRGVLKEGWLGVVRGTTVTPAAEFFINAYIATQAQESLALKRGVVPVNKEARADLAKDPVLKETLLLSEGDVRSMMRVDWQKLDSELSEKWSRAVAK